MTDVRTASAATASGRRRRTRWLAFVLAAAALLAFSPGTALGKEPGDLAPTFSGDGIRYVDFGRYDTAASLFPDAAGRLLLAGQASGPYGERPEFAAARLSPDARLDRTFGSAGRLRIDRGFAHDYPVAWKQSPDGGLVALAIYGDSGYYLMRFCPDGAVDRSFGEDGVVFGSFDTDYAEIDDLLVEPSGRILVLGNVEGAVVLRAHRPDGRRARGFGTNGTVRVPGTAGRALLRQPSGRILIFGNRGSRRLVLEAFRSDGSRAVAFGENGRGTILLDRTEGSLVALVPRVASLAGDGIVVTAELDVSFQSDAIIARFTAAGEPERGFGGGDGWRRLDIGNIDAPNALVALPSGRLLVVGTIAQDRFGDDLSTDLFIAGLRPDGRTWRGFGNEGSVRTDFGRDDDWVRGRDAALVDGRLVVVGAARTDMYAARFLVGP